MFGRGLGASPKLRAIGRRKTLLRQRWRPLSAAAACRELRMQLRRTVPILLSLLVLGIGTLLFLGSRGALPPALADAYESMASLASSASGAIQASRAASDGPDAGDAGPAGVHRTTQAAPLSSAQLGAPLVHGRFVTECGAPADMKVVVKVTVKMGRPIDVSVKSDPANSAVASCVERATREMQWDVSPKTQHATVTY